MRNFITFSFAFLFFLSSLKLFAGDANYHLFLQKNNLQTGKVLELVTPLANTGTAGNVATLREAHVRLIYGREGHSDVQGSDWEFRVVYRIDAVGNGFSDIDTLEIQHHDENGIYESLGRYAGLSTGQAKVTILEIWYRNSSVSPWQSSNNAANVSLVPNDIRLELHLEETQYHEWVSGQKLQVDHQYVFTAGQESYIDIYWDYVPGMESSELEIAFWDDEIAANVQPQGASDNKAFKHAIRVETTEQHYRLDLTYPSGKLYYRVRPIGKFVQNTNGDYSYRREGAWSYNLQAGKAPQVINAFEPNKSWQFSTVFAEEGKSKKVISYFDESMRARQVATYLNDDKRTLVGETDYSLEGQAVLSILPVPASMQENNLFFKPAFNKNSAGATYGYEDFDRTGIPNSLATNAGAGEYYSTVSTDLYSEYIPNAGGYPLSQMRYKRDGTGRVAVQGGVGNFYQLESGRETQYFYGSASSTELRRLFGSNVGNATHYEKHVTVDANGQVSVAYVDQAGQTIATALAGEEPNNLLPLDNQDTYRMEKDLMEGNSRTADESYLDYTLLKVLPGTKNYDFAYSLTGLYYSFAQVINNQPRSICRDCQYKVEITVQDPNGDYLSPSSISNGATLEQSIVNNDTINTITQTYTGAQLQQCVHPVQQSYVGTDINFSMSFLALGEYRVTKKLTLYRPSPNDLLNDLAAENLLPELSDFMPDIDTTQCNFFTDPSTLSSGELMSYFDATNEADCSSLLEQIKRQVSPGGAFYATMTQDIFVLGQSFPVVQNGTISYITLVDSNQDGVWDYSTDGVSLTDASGNPLASVSIWDASQQQQLYVWAVPYSLVYEFLPIIKNSSLFQQGWAAELAKGHREYCHYQQCSCLIDSDNYDMVLSVYRTWNQWAGANPPATFPNQLEVYNNDPFSSATSCFTDSKACRILPFQTRFLNALNNYNGSNQSLWDYVNTVLYPTYATANTPTIYIHPITGISTVDTLKWQMFASNYRAIKDEIKNFCANCTYFEDANAIAQNTTQFNDMDMGELQNYAAGQIEDQCELNCAAQVQNWIGEINQFLNGCGVAPIPAATLTTLETELSSYCAENCDHANPLGYILTTDLNPTPPATINQHLANALITINGLIPQNSSCLLTDLVNIIAVDPVDVYTTTTVTIPAGVQGYQLQSYQTCFEEVVDLINEERNNLAYTYNSSCFGVLNNININNNNNTYTSIEILNSSGNTNCKAELSVIGADSAGLANYCNNINGTILLPAGTIQYLSSSYVDICGNNNPQWVGLISYQNGNTTEQAYLIEVATLIPCPMVNTTTEITISTPIWDTELTEYNLDLEALQDSCINMLIAAAQAEAEDAWNQAVAGILTNYNTALTSCWNNPFQEEFTVEYEDGEYHYTLYYYDQAGNLVQTIPPVGVKPLSLDPAQGHFNSKGKWNATMLGNVYLHDPTHNTALKTVYQYNSLGQVSQQTSPDGGLTKFYYDDVQRLRLSQNAKQAVANNYSYTRYDEQSRIVEVGELVQYTTPVNTTTFDNHLQDLYFPQAALYSTREMVKTTYDVAAGTVAQSNLRGRVTKIENARQTNYYDYDIMGNVKNYYQDVFGLDLIQINYEYDLVSGNVKAVHYRPGKVDQFHHRYRYDADNRLRTAYSSNDGYIWNKEARYFYYAHGPLARTETGENIAGSDYRYTLQGWIVGVNMPDGANQGTSLDPGKDGQQNGALNRWFARDEYAYNLGYHEQAYSPLGGNTLQSGALTAAWNGLGGNGNILGNTFASGTVKGLYNGNIAYMVTQVRELQRQNKGSGLQGMAYQYDQLHRIRKSRSHDYLGTWQAEGYNSDYTYDANGNIKTLERKASGNLIDNLTYGYNYQPNSTIDLVNNKLRHVTDAVTAVTVGDLATQVVDNYEYDEIGNLIKDKSEKIKEIRWNVQGKVETVIFDLVADPTRSFDAVSYTYDPMGNRLTKTKHNLDNQRYNREITWYVRDAQGNILSVYESYEENIFGHSPTAMGASYTNIDYYARYEQKEVHIYGSSRLGMRRKSVTIRGVGEEPARGGGMQPIVADILGHVFSDVRGEKSYEQSNHLGNVLVTLSDKLRGIPTSIPNVANFYAAIVNQAQLYYDFGWDMPNRGYHSTNDYRFGFNGKENDKDWGSQLIQDYGFRLYNPAIAKFLSFDPLAPEYPELTPYQFASNTPIQAIDLDGLEAWVAIWASSTGQSGHVALVLPEVKKIGPGKFEATGKFVVWDVYGERSNDFQFWVNSPNQKVGGRAQRRVFSYQQITVDTREGGNAKEKNPIYRAAGAPDYILGIDKEASGSFMEAYVIDKELQKLFKNPDISFSLEAPKDGYTGNEDPHKVPFSCGGFVSWAIKKFYGVNSTAEHMLAKESRYLGTTTPAVDMKVFTPKSIFESIYEKATSIEKIEGKRNQRADFILKKPTLDNASDGVVKDLNPQQ